MEIEKAAIDRVIPYARNPRQNVRGVDKVAASIREFGWRQPIVVDEAFTIIVGHTRYLAAKKLGLAEVPVHIARGLSPSQVRAYRIADNRTNEESQWDLPLLNLEFLDLKTDGFDLSLTGFNEVELKKLLEQAGGQSGTNTDDETPDVQAVAVSSLGDVWKLGAHRVMAGDSRDAEAVKTLMGGKLAQLIHADPPYGMGKQADGVLNDNIYGAKLDEFQMAWWRAFRPHVQSNGSAYIWGNAPDLWRLWYAGGLNASEPLTLRNEIVWDKACIAGMASPDMTQYAEATERCLFIQFGRFVFQVNQTKDDYWPGWESLRTYLCGERDKSGLTAGAIKKICGNHMYGHWFGTSQWVFIAEKDYEKLCAATNGQAFARPYEELRDEYKKLQQIYNGEVRDPARSEFDAGRPYFDNAHDIMRDVWQFNRVVGEERHGHATPKPVAMMERVMKSSLRAGEICVEPFCGSGSTVMGAERTGRICYTMELDPKYVDVTIRRWQKATGLTAYRESDGVSFNELAARPTAQAA